MKVITRNGYLLELVTGPTLEVFLTVQPTKLNKKVSHKVWHRINRLNNKLIKQFLKKKHYE